MICHIFSLRKIYFSFTFEGYIHLFITFKYFTPLFLLTCFLTRSPVSCLYSFINKVLYFPDFFQIHSFFMCRLNMICLSVAFFLVFILLSALWDSQIYNLSIIICHSFWEVLSNYYFKYFFCSIFSFYSFWYSTHILLFYIAPQFLVILFCFFNFLL